jgi:hypothetical protein
MKHETIDPQGADEALDMHGILERVAAVSHRPRYTMLVLDLIARLAGDSGKAGPWIADGDSHISVREWLCQGLTPMAARNPKRIALATQVRAAFEATASLPADPEQARRMVEDEVRARVRKAGLSGVSRAVSDLVSAGLISRYYEGYRVDHENRGAQRRAVYTVPAPVRDALNRRVLL